MSPILGTGATGFEFEDGARLVCEVVQQYEPSNVTVARNIAYTQREYETPERVADDPRLS